MTPETLEYILSAGFILDVLPYADAPLASEDQVIFADELTGQVIVARAPIQGSRTRVA